MLNVSGAATKTPPTEATDDLVTDQQNPIFVPVSLNLGPVGFQRDDQPPASHPEHACHAANRGTTHRRAVIGIVPADDDMALPVTKRCPKIAHHAHICVIRFRSERAERAEKHMRGTVSGQADDSPCQFGRWLLGRLEKAVEIRQAGGSP